ncbi:MAG: hypothetical protein H6719_15625 [Sandaracinaceae bacterium]|nr:hypothetical protein [Sandaracinaceae bacterium]
MTAHAMTMDAAIEGPNSPAEARSESPPVAWRGYESPWVLAAIAAAPWPIWSLIALFGIPGGGVLPRSQGVLALALVLAVMGVWTHRPSGRSATRWFLTVLGTGLLGELLANALTDMGRAPGLGAASDLQRAGTIWLICVTVYEVAPIVAASARVARSERRSLPLDLTAHAGFLLAAAGAYAWQPTWGTSWFVSPWLAVAIALPLAAARSGPDREAATPTPHPRGGVLFGLAGLGWAMLGLVVVARLGMIRESLHDMRWGVEPADGVLLVIPMVSALLSSIAAAALLVRARAVRRTVSGTISEVGDGGVTIDRGGDEPTSVAIERGPLPVVGQRVTLIGAGVHPPGVGPFRDGAPQLRARRAWLGSPDELARSLRQRAARWLAWGAVGAFGVLLRLL